MAQPATSQLAIEHNYGKSTPYSIGVEEEFQLVHRDTFELTSRVELLLDQATEADHARIKPELMQSVIECATKVCRNAAEAQHDLLALRRRVGEMAENSDCCIASSGTHPYSRYEFQKITDRERYAEIINRLKWVAQRELIFGLHVHVGIDSPDKAMYVFNAIRGYLPQMLALAANSPFWQGRHTGLLSSRIKVFDSFPRSGVPQSFDSWAEWEALVQRAVKVGALPDYTFIWWDVRPHPRFGTIEVRIMDGQTRIEHALALAALVQATCAWLGDLHDRGVRLDAHPTLLVNENKWSACRYGMEGEFIDLESDTVVSAREAVQSLLDTVEPYAKQLGSLEQFSVLPELVERNGARRQLDVYAQTESLMSVAEMLVRETNDF